MGKKLQILQPGLVSKKDENRNCSSRGLSSVFDLWQNCSNQRLKLVLGSSPKRVPRDKMDNKKVPRVDEGKRTVKAHMDEESSKEQSKFAFVGFPKKKQRSDERKSNLSEDNKEAEAFINEALRKYFHKDRRNHHSQRFLDALTILKSNEELFLKLIQDPNSLLVKHIRNLQDLHAEKERSKLVRKPKSPEETTGLSLRDEGNLKFEKRNMYNLVWGKIKTRYEYPSKLNKNPRALKQVEISENVSCHCSSLQSHSSKNKNNFVEFSFRTKSKYKKGEEGKDPTGYINSGLKPDIASLDENMCKSSGSSFVRYPNGRDIDILEEEAKRHLSERLMISKQKNCFSDKESPRILGKILHLPRTHIFDLELDKLRNSLLDTKGSVGISSADQMVKKLSRSGDFNILEFPSSPSSTNDTITEQNIDSVSSSEKTEDSECSGQVSLLRYQLLVSSLDDSSLTLKNIQKGESRADHMRPVSVLEPLFIDDINSRPSSTDYQSGTLTIQPMLIGFEEHSPMGSSPNIDGKSDSTINDLNLVSAYIEALLQTSSFSWDELFLSLQSYSSNQFFDPNLMNEVKLPLIGSCDHTIFFDSVNEAISEVYQCYFKSSPLVSSLLSRPVLIETSVVDEIKRRVENYFCPRALPKTIEQLAGEDHVRSQTWMDIREDIEEITVQVVECIVEKLIQDIVF